MRFGLSGIKCFFVAVCLQAVLASDLVLAQSFSPSSRCFHYLLQHLSPEGTLPGTIVASPSKENPNYWYHWTRDGALVQSLLSELYRDLPKGSDLRAQLRQNFLDYVALSSLHQTADLGEPKFEVDGSPFVGEWGRPQNDGPALRALALMRWREAIKNDGALPENLIELISKDLDYTAQTWRDPSYDLWEEIKGDHFYNRVLQAAALLAGTKLFASTDEERSRLYEQEAQKIRQSLVEFRDHEENRYLASIGRTAGLDNKHSQLDVSILLALLHAFPEGEDIVPFSDPHLLRTLVKLDEVFSKIYSINGLFLEHELGNAIGRYPEDQYDGYSTQSKANPWFLATLAMAEILYRLRAEWERQAPQTPLDEDLQFFANWLGVSPHENTPQLLERLNEKAASYFRRVHFHWDQTAERMSEQFHREHGHMQGAEDLSWSYAAYLSAVRAREN